MSSDDLVVPLEPLETWYTRRTTEVLTEVVALVRREASTAEQAALLETTFASFSDELAEQPSCWPAIHLPLLVYHALRGDDAPALPVAVATTCLFAGFDVLDDLADGDAPAAWQAYRPAELQLAALTLLCALPTLALRAGGVPAPARAALLDTIAGGGLRIAAGQQQDLRLMGSAAPAAASAEAALARGGEELGLFAGLAAQHAGATSAAVEAWTEFGRGLGALWQLRADWDDLFGPAPSKDLANGARTLPIALALRHLRGEAHADLLTLLARAREDPTARPAVRAMIARSGATWHVAWLGQVYGQRARRALGAAAPSGPAVAILEQLIADDLPGSRAPSSTTAISSSTSTITSAR